MAWSGRTKGGQFARSEERLEAVVRQATEIGQEACRYALQRAGYYRGSVTNYEPTYNIVDAIGSAVYVDGVLRPETKRYAIDTPMSTSPYHDKGWKPPRGLSTGEYIAGRDALERYWEAHPTLPNKRKNVVEVVCVAATFYSGILESKGVQVISAATDYFAQVAKNPKYKIYQPRLNAVGAGDINV
jgi:hypothetical protein